MRRSCASSPLSPRPIRVKTASTSLLRTDRGRADIFLMPSRFEPCGLNQMYSCVTARSRSFARGGLVDTVTDYSDPAGWDGLTFRP